MKKVKIIIDTDPGIDDINAIVFAMFDKFYDIKLITTVCGNVSIDISTRNMCHILDIFHKDVPVAKGADEPLFRRPIYARQMHGDEGMGNYIPPKTTIHQPIEEDAIEAMYDVILKNPNEITLVVLGPHTNIAKLLRVHPDSARLIKQIVFMGASPYGMLEMPEHISFNIKSDPEAFDMVLGSGIPLVMIPSYIGRRLAHLTEEQVTRVALTSSVGKFFSKMFETYWEPCEDKRIATNDTCAVFYLKYPSIYQMQRADITVDVNKDLGKTIARFHKRGKVNVVVGLNRNKYIKYYFQALERVNVMLDDSIYEASNKRAKSNK